jgi:hypothetical protein
MMLCEYLCLLFWGTWDWTHGLAYQALYLLSLSPRPFVFPFLRQDLANFALAALASVAPDSPASASHLHDSWDYKHTPRDPVPACTSVCT